MKYLFFIEQRYSFAILRPLADEAARRGESVAWFLFNGGSELLKEKDMILPDVGSVSSFNPDAVIAPGNWVPHFFPGCKVQVFHGFGIEKAGHFKIRGLFDLYCTHGPLTTDWFTDQARRLKHFNVVETGWPKLDTWPPCIDEREKIGSTVRVLYAPTFSDSLTSVPDLFDGIIALSKRPDVQMTVKLHTLMALEWGKRFQQAQHEGLQLLADDDLLHALAAADIVISDTSSAVSEALYLGKPVLTYRTKQPGSFTLDFIVATELAEKFDVVRDSYNFWKHAGRTRADAMHPYRDGASSGRVLDAISECFAGRLPPRRAKPLNLLRKWKIYRSMQSFRVKRTP